MQTNTTVLELLEEKTTELTRLARRAIILQPGAIGDCILTLPLAQFIKDSLELGGIDILGRAEYLSYFPGRTSVDGIRSIDSMNLHQLFVEPRQFNIPDGDPLINSFSDYSWIISFMGEPDGHFEHNLIFTANCSHSAEVITLPLKPPKRFSGHISNFYIKQFIKHSGLNAPKCKFDTSRTLINKTRADRELGIEILKEAGLDCSDAIAVLHPGSGGQRKCWHLDNYLAVAKYIDTKGLRPIFLLGPVEIERLNQSQISDIKNTAACLTDLSLTQVVGLLNCAKVFIGNDSGITHLGAGLGVRTIAVFGTTNPNTYKPIGPDVKFLVGPGRSFADTASPKMQNELIGLLNDFVLNR